MKRTGKRVTAVLLSIALLYGAPQNASAFADTDRPDAGQTDAFATGVSGGVEAAHETSLAPKSRAAAVLETLENAEEGTDYDKGEVVFYLGYDPEEKLIEKARRTAFSCNGVLVDYEMGAGLIRLPSTPEEAEANAREYAESIYGEDNADLFLEGREYEEVTVDEAVREAIDDPATPIIEPNYHRYFTDQITEPTTITGCSDTTSFGYTAETDEVTTALSADPFLDMENEDYQYYHHAIGSDIAWEAGYHGDSSIKVAVIDTGVSAKHEDLQNVEQISINHAKDLPLEPDSQTHGTHVAGIIAAVSGNQAGGCGIAPGVTILSYNIEHTGDTGLRSFDIISAILRGITDGADIINMSIGSVAYSKIEDEVTKEAYECGISMFAAMGNDGCQIYNFPAGYECVTAVGATGVGGARAEYSNFGDWCDISAPGSLITSTVLPRLSEDCDDEGTPEFTGYYGNMSGTSMATPVISGAAALYMSAFGNPGPEKMTELLCKATVECPSAKMGAGIIDVAKLMGVKRSVSPAADNRSMVSIYMDDDHFDPSDVGFVEAGSSIKLWAAYDTEPAETFGPAQVEWSIQPSGSPRANLKDDAFDKNMITIDENGVLKVHKNCLKYLLDKSQKYALVEVKAQTSSGHWRVNTIAISRKCSKPKKVKKWYRYTIGGKWSPKKTSTIKLNTASNEAEVHFTMKTTAPYWSVESSNDNIAQAFIPEGGIEFSDDFGSTRCTMVILANDEKGTATITARCLDGSGKTLKWKVKNS